MLVKKYFVVERISVRVKWFGVKFYFFFILVLSGGIATASEQSLEQAVNIEQSASTEQPSILFVPAFSYFIPGLGSFIDGDYSRAFKFLGYGAIGLGIAKSTQERIDDFEKNNPRESHHHRDLIRENQIGGMMVAHSRMLSVY